MRAKQQQTIPLPNEIVDVSEAEVQVDNDATESEVACGRVCEQSAPDHVTECWLREQVGPAYDALKADPSRGLNAGHVRARLAAEHAKTR
jgi:hypothetical protein